MTSPTSATTNRKARKILVQLLLGGVAGAAGMFALLTALEGVPGILEDGGRIAALATALIYLLMAALVGFGALVPGVGAKTLNVEDADEVSEQRTALLVGSLTFLLVAAFLTSVALADGGSGVGALSNSTAAVIAIAATLGLIAVSIRYRRLGDEMMQMVSREANGIMVGLVFLTAGIKSAAARLGYAAPVQPLEFLAGFFALYLAAIFIAVGRRGLLAPR